MMVGFDHIITFDQNSVNFVKSIGNHLEYIPYDIQVKLVLAKYVNIGEIGVAMFFLVSGFLIMHSRQIHKNSEYILLRFFRIYPICIASVIFCFLIIAWADNVFFEVPYPFSTTSFLSILYNSLLLQDITSYPVIIPVFWSLLVEIKFYILMLACKGFKQKDLLTLSFILLVIVCANSLFLDRVHSYGYPILSKTLMSMAFASVHILYMIIGSFLYVTFRPILESEVKLGFKEIFYKIGTKNILIFFILYISFCFGRSAYDAGPHNLPHFIKNYSISLLVFILSLIYCKNLSSINIKPLKFFNNISYPLYTLHYTVGAVSVFLLSRLLFFRENLFLMYFASFLTITLVSYLFHAAVEKPFMRYSRNLLKNSK